LNVTAEDRIYQGFSICFDMSFEQIWISYLAGANLWIAPKAINPSSRRPKLNARRWLRLSRPRLRP
jgi:predicted amidohydrolase